MDKTKEIIKSKYCSIDTTSIKEELSQLDLISNPSDEDKLKINILNDLLLERQIKANMTLLKNYLEDILNKNNKNTYTNKVQFEFRDKLNIHKNSYFIDELNKYMDSIHATYEITKELEQSCIFVVTFLDWIK